jgi:pimeloyl-ACP methyl ester esterase
MPFLTHAGVSLRYDRTGAGPAVLLIHGWTGNRTFWDRQVQALRASHTVITVDLRGHGESSRPRTGYSVGAMTADLEHLVRALGLPRVALVGWSMGGLLALELARRLGDRVSALGLVCSTAGGLTEAGNPRAQPERAAEFRAAIDADFREFVRGFLVQLFKSGADAPHYQWVVAQAQKTPPHVAAACFDAMLAADLRPNLPALRVPTAVFHGRHDTLTPLADGEYLASHIPGARLVVFEDSAHAPFLEEPEAFDTALRALLSGEAPGDAPKAQPPPKPAAAQKEAAPKDAVPKQPPKQEAAGGKHAAPKKAPASKTKAPAPAKKKSPAAKAPKKR